MPAPSEVVCTLNLTPSAYTSNEMGPNADTVAIAPMMFLRIVFDLILFREICC